MIILLYAYRARSLGLLDRKLENEKHCYFLWEVGKRDECFGEMFSIFFLFSMEFFFLPTTQEFYSMENPKSSRTFHQMTHLFFQLLIKISSISIIFLNCIKQTLHFQWFSCLKFLYLQVITQIWVLLLGGLGLAGLLDVWVGILNWRPSLP